MRHPPTEPASHQCHIFRTSHPCACVPCRTSQSSRKQPSQLRCRGVSFGRPRSLGRRECVGEPGFWFGDASQSCGSVGRRGTTQKLGSVCTRDASQKFGSASWWTSQYVGSARMESRCLLPRVAELRTDTTFDWDIRFRRSWCRWNRNEECYLMEADFLWYNTGTESCLGNSENTGPLVVQLKCNLFLWHSSAWKFLV